MRALVDWLRLFSVREIVLLLGAIVPLTIGCLWILAMSALDGYRLRADRRRWRARRAQRRREAPHAAEKGHEPKDDQAQHQD